MKILHLIDSLNPGGAERMAVAYANALAEKGYASFLMASRKEGSLKETILPEVSYIFLNRKNKMDIPALLRARRVIQTEGIQLIHAHGTSWFFASLLKFLCPGIKLVWHDHYGLSENLVERPDKVLRCFSRYFDAIFCVNHELMDWAKRKLYSNKVYYIKNFAEKIITEAPNFELKGKKGSRLVCLANLREQKDHLNLLRAFQLLLDRDLGLTLHLLGKDFEDICSRRIRKFIDQNALNENVYLHGSQSGVYSLLKQCTLGILSSSSEGLPVALLEYGLAGLPVVVTDVGYCREVVNGYGKIVEPGDPEALVQAILFYLENPQQGQKDAIAFQKHVKNTYSREAVFPEVLEIYQNLLQEE